VRKRLFILLLVLSFVTPVAKLSAFTIDTTAALKPAKAAKLPKHYFNDMFYLDYYTIGKRTLDTVNTVSKKLKTYQLGQLTLGFNVPVVTKDFYSKDSTRISNLNFLLTGSYNRLNLDFGGIDRHYLAKTAIGFRGMYNNGKKSIFFVELSPFVTKDVGYRYTRTYRLATTVLYDCSVNQYFAFRLGFTRSFLWGNRFNLPYIGIRVGRLDKINFSLQFPRSITFNVPVGQYFRFSLYTKPQGGLYSFANTDSIQLGNPTLDNKKLFFGRYEFLSGARVDVLPSKHFTLYLSGGLTTGNYIAFFPPRSRDNFSIYQHYFKENIKGTAYVNFGLVFRFGKTKSYYNNRQAYGMMDLNNSQDTGETGVNPGNGNIPVPAKKAHKTSAAEVIDLMETQDLY